MHNIRKSKSTYLNRECTRYSDVLWIPTEPNAYIIATVLPRGKNKLCFTKHSFENQSSATLCEIPCSGKEWSYHLLKQSPNDPNIVAFSIKTELHVVRMHKKTAARVRFTTMGAVQWFEFSQTEKDVIIFGSFNYAYVSYVFKKALLSQNLEFIFPKNHKVHSPFLFLLFCSFPFSFYVRLFDLLFTSFYFDTEIKI